MNGLFLLLLPLIVYGTRLRFGKLLGKQCLSKVTATPDSLMGILQERPIWLDDYGAPPDLNPPLEGWQSCIRLSLDHKTMTVATNGAAHMVIVRGDMVYEHDGSPESSVQVAEGDFIIIIISNPLVPHSDLNKLCHRAHFKGRLWECMLGPEYFYDRMAIRIERESESEGEDDIEVEGVNVNVNVSVNSESKDSTDSNDSHLVEEKNLSSDESSEELSTRSFTRSFAQSFTRSFAQSFAQSPTQSPLGYAPYTSQTPNTPLIPCVQSLSIALPTSRLQRHKSMHTKTCEKTSRRPSPRSKNTALSDPKPSQDSIALPSSGSPLSISLSESDNISGSGAFRGGPVVSLDDIVVQDTHSTLVEQKRAKFKDRSRSRSFLSLDTTRLTRRTSNKEKKHNVSAEEEVLSPKVKERKTLTFERMKRSRSKSPQPVESKDPDSPKQTDK